MHDARMNDSMRIEIACKGADALPYHKLTPFQSELKTLSKDHAERLKHQIVNTGFSAPIFVWANDGKNWILDGHQRVRVIRKMVEQDGYTCPPLPVVWVEAVTKEMAYRKLLSIASQYGKIEGEGLHDFMEQAGMGAEDMDSFNFTEINPEEFVEEYFPDQDPESDPPGEPDPPTDPPGPEHKCPKCGHEFSE